MFQGNTKILEDKIVSLFARQGTLDAFMLQKKLDSKVSIQGIYRVLRKLQHEGVLVKTGQLYSLRIPWILNLAQEVEQMQSVYLQESYLNQFLPKNNKEKLQWSFTSLLKMNDFWSQVILAMAKVARSGTALDWSPHPWFHLLQTKKESQYLQSTMGLINKMYAVIGGNTYLDEWATQFWDDDGIEYYLTENKKEWIDSNRALYYVVIDDWVNTVRLDTKTVGIIDDMYQSVKSENDLHFQQITMLLSKRVRAVVTVEKNNHKALMIQKKFQKLFGPLQM